MDEGTLQRTFGENVRRLRLQRGLSQERLADILVVHRTFVGSVERGERNLTLRSVERLAIRLDADPLELLTPAMPTKASRKLRAAATGDDPPKKQRRTKR